MGNVFVTYNEQCYTSTVPGDEDSSISSSPGTSQPPLSPKATNCKSAPQVGTWELHIQSIWHSHVGATELTNMALACESYRG